MNDLKEKVIEKAIKEIEKSFVNGDLTALYELLEFVDLKYLLGFLPEEENTELINQFKKNKNKKNFVEGLVKK